MAMAGGGECEKDDCNSETETRKVGEKDEKDEIDEIDEIDGKDILTEVKF